MATQQEWREYFELTNDRTPTLEEFKKAKENGEFDDEISPDLTPNDSDAVRSVQMTMTDNPEPKKKSKVPMNWGFAVLGFFITIVGLILFLVWKNDEDEKNREKGWSAGKGALVSFGLGVIITIISWIMIGVAVNHASQQLNNYTAASSLQVYSSSSSSDNTDESSTTESSSSSESLPSLFSSVNDFQSQIAAQGWTISTQFLSKVDGGSGVPATDDSTFYWSAIDKLMASSSNFSASRISANGAAATYSSPTYGLIYCVSAYPPAVIQLMNKEGKAANLLVSNEFLFIYTQKDPNANGSTLSKRIFIEQPNGSGVYNAIYSDATGDDTNLMDTPSTSIVPASSVTVTNNGDLTIQTN